MSNIIIKINKNLKMSPGKLASQAVHAALNAYGINHGSVVVLQGTKTQVEAMDTVVIDEGLTEIPEGSTTAGAALQYDFKHGSADNYQENKIEKYADDYGVIFERRVIYGPWVEVK